MAKLKKQVVIHKFGTRPDGTWVLQIWADNVVTQEVLAIVGVASVTIHTENPITVCTDPRADVDEVIVELEELLSAKVPSVFYDDPQ